MWCTPLIEHLMKMYKCVSFSNLLHANPVVGLPCRNSPPVLWCHKVRCQTIAGNGAQCQLCNSSVFRTSGTGKSAAGADLGQGGEVLGCFMKGTMGQRWGERGWILWQWYMLIPSFYNLHSFFLQLYICHQKRWYISKVSHTSRTFAEESTNNLISCLLSGCLPHSGMQHMPCIGAGCGGWEGAILVQCDISALSDVAPQLTSILRQRDSSLSRDAD